MTESIDWFEASLLERGVKARSVASVLWRLRRILAPVLFVDTSDITPPRAEELYLRFARSGVAVDTHRNALNAAKAWSKWCVAKKYMVRNPFAHVEGVGRRKAGDESKPQLTLTESRKFLDACLSLAAQPHAGAIAAMSFLLLGCRAGELLDRQVRDLDDDGRLLWIRRSKTRASSRRLEVPEILQPHLLAMAAGKSPTDPLFGQTRQWAWDWVQEICKRAGVTMTGPHGLRGTHATLATLAGATGSLVAGELGHASTGTTDRNYVQRGARRVAVQRSSWRILDGGRS